MAKHGGFPGMGMGGNMQQLARQAQKLQQQMTEKQAELEAREFEASAGGGMVTVQINGKVKSVVTVAADADEETIRAQFGEDVAMLVSGLTKLVAIGVEDKDYDNAVRVLYDSFMK